MKRIAILCAAIAATATFSGCTAFNAYTGAAINAGEASFAGAKQNIQAIDDAKFIGWMDAACAMPIGALQRNATGNSDAVPAVLTACPVPGVAVINTKNGSITVSSTPTITAATPTNGYVAPAATPTISSATTAQ
jgi:hypothetical protein